MERQEVCSKVSRKQTKTEIQVNMQTSRVLAVSDYSESGPSVCSFDVILQSMVMTVLCLVILVALVISFLHLFVFLVVVF